MTFVQGSHRGVEFACAGFTLTVLLIVVTGTVSAQTVRTLYSFGSFAANPVDVARQGRDGQIYGATANGGLYALGTIFKIDTGGKAVLLHSFNGSDGSYPRGGLTLGADGNFYGTTYEGGTFGFGVLFRITANGTLTVLHSFNMDGTDGVFPQNPPILASDGNYYGTTASGGTNDVGTVYKLTPAGAYTVIYNLDPAIANQAIGGPTQGSDGNLYITGWFQGTSICGSIMKISTAGALLNSVLNCTSNGANPTGNLLQASDGNFFGTTSFGGTYSTGVLFKLTPSFSYSVLHDFGATQAEGNTPTGPVMQGTDGNLYGLDRNGGEFGYGTIYRCSLTGTCSTLDSWSSQVYPAPQLIQHTNGSFYGATWAGGVYDLGTFFTMKLGFKPFITFVLDRAKAGNTVQILGQGLTSTTSVTFNGLSATGFKVFSDTYMTAVVPAGATSGTVVVTTATQTLKSNQKFQVIR